MKFILIAFVFLLSTPAYASEMFGLAMVGEPKYSESDTHLEYANPDAPKGGTLKQSATGGFDTLNPFTIKGKAPLGMNLVHDRLMARVWDEPFTLYPLVAKSVEVPEDRSSITFHLNPEAKFHDGQNMDADDVIFTFETLREKGRPNQRRIYQLADAIKINDSSVRFDFKDGFDRETALIMGLMPVLPQHYWQDKEFDKTTLDAPLGSGPYKIKQAEVGKRIVYERVPDYWAKDHMTNKGHHNFDEIIYEYYRDDTVAFESFKKGDLDIRREWDAGTWHQAYDFEATNSGKVIKADIKHGRAEKVRGFIFNTRRAPFDDIRVRQALAKVFDFDWMNKNFFFGAYEQVNSFYPNTELGQPRESNASQDLRSKRREAETLLKDAGWIIQDGKRVNAETGEPMAFEIILDNPADEKIALSLTRTLNKMGIEVRVRVMDSAAYRGRMGDYDFDMTLSFWHSTLSPGTEQYLYWSCESAETPSRWNYAGICDPEIDELAKAIPTAKTREELVNLTRALDQKLWEGQYFIPLYYNPNDYVAYWEHIERPENTPLYGIVTETWWMKP